MPISCTNFCVRILSEWDPHVGAIIWILPIDQWFKCFTECVWVYTLMHFEQQARKLPLRHADLITMNIAWWEHGAMRSYLKETPLYSPQLCISFTSLHSSRPSALPPKERAEWLILSHLSPGASWQLRVRVCVFRIGVQMSRGLFSFWLSRSGWQKTPASLVQAADIFSQKRWACCFPIFSTWVPRLQEDEEMPCLCMLACVSLV